MFFERITLQNTDPSLSKWPASFICGGWNPPKMLNPIFKLKRGHFGKFFHVVGNKNQSLASCVCSNM
jgi:hypothetical protein